MSYTKNQLNSGSAVLALTAVLCGFSPALQAQEEPTGSLYLFPIEANVSRNVGGLSGDGQSAGGSYYTMEGSAPLIWNVDAGLVPLHPITISGGVANALSDDGTVLGGRFNARAYIWVINGESDYLYNEDGNAFLGEVFAVSGDGLVLAGTRNDGAGNNVPFIWTEADGTSALPLPEGYIAATVNAINADGSVIVGSAIDPNVESVGIIWANGDYELVTVEGEQVVQVVDVLPDGEVVLVSTSYSTLNPSFVLEIESGDRFPLALGDNPVTFTVVEDDGEEELVIVGNRRMGSNPRWDFPVFAWDMDDNGVIVDETNLQEILIDQFDLDPETTSFEEVYAIADAKGIITGVITIEGFPYNCIYSEETSFGVVELEINDPEEPGGRFAELIEESTVVDGWVLDAWLGVFWAEMFPVNGWIYHLELEWLYVNETGEGTGFWMYSNSLEQWIYTEESVAPWVYLSTDDVWVYNP